MEHKSGLSIRQMEVVNETKYPPLWLCLAMDAVGIVSSLSLLTEWIDLCWAPVSAYVFYQTFGGRTGKLGAMLNLAEEALPFADFLPTYTLAYLYQRWQAKKHKTQDSQEKAD